jgi:branched-chain amino acid transport system permease protein
MVYVINGLTFAMLLFIIAAGLNIALGFLGVLNFAHGALFLVGAYLTYAITTAWGGSFWLALLVAPFMVGVIGGIMEVFFLRPLYRRHHVYTLLLTFGMILVIYDLIKIIWGTDVKTVPMPASLTGALSLFGGIIPVSSLFILLIGILTALGIWLLFQKTKLGKILRAVSLDREVAGALGFNVPLNGTIAFMLSATLAGLGGVLGTLRLSIAPGVDAEFLIYSFAIVVIGGVSSFRGTFLAALIVGEMHALGGVFFPQLAMTFVFVLLVVFLTIYPRGLFGREIEQIHVPIAPHMGEVGAIFKWFSPKTTSLIGGVVLLLIFAVAPLWLSKYWLFLCAEILVFALFAISFNVLFGFTGMLSFGQASIFAAGAYSISLMMKLLGTPWWLAFLGSMAISTGVSVIIGLCTIHRSEIYFGMLTLAFAQLFYTIIYKWTSLTGGPDGLTGIPSPRIGLAGWELTIRSPMSNYYFMLIMVGLSYLVIRKVMRSPFGQVLLAIRENPHRTEYMGLNTNRYKLIAFVMAGFFTGVSGALFGPFAGTIDAHASHWSKSGEPIFMSLIGGISTLIGPGLGTFIYYTLNSFIVSVTQYWQLVMGIIIVFVVMVFPMGVTGYGKKMVLMLAGRNQRS